MEHTILHELLDEKGYLLADGATGTNLFGMGLISGDAPRTMEMKSTLKKY